MPDWVTAIEANQFWASPESDLFPLPVVAFALGIGRNNMHRVPVDRILVKGRAFYRKSDILDWAETEDGQTLWRELRDRNTSIGRAAKKRQLIQEGTPDERGEREAEISRLEKELWELNRYIDFAPPDDIEAEQTRMLAVDTFNRLAELEKGIPKHRKRSCRFRGKWWLIDDPEQRKKAYAEYEALLDELYGPLPPDS